MSKEGEIGLLLASMIHREDVDDSVLTSGDDVT
jgi:hypothetical protein